MIIKLTTCLILGIKPQQKQSSILILKMTEDAVFIGTDATENGANPTFKNLLNRILIKGRLGILQY
jgi:hypothetical protein